ncbi:MAG: hypothetical protein KatS3mg003_0513 [Candidatus Nitrosocaldaceae archaeon]|nr:MAG: hypothetical protein KatS3mg003_0513 [Candidatus Nitrosocaldaceae archaeon]
MSNDAKVQIPNDIVNALNEMGIYNIEQFVINLLDDTIKEKKGNSFSDNEQEMLEEQLQGLGYI